MVNWEALGAIGEIVGALGVIATLAYLTIQIRTNSTAIQTSTYLGVVSSPQIRLAMASDPKLSELFRIGMAEPERLTDEERFQFRQLILHQCRHFENIHYQFESGFVEDHLWEAWQRSMVSFFSQPGARVLWDAEHLTIFNKHFNEFVSDLIAQGPED